MANNDKRAILLYIDVLEANLSVLNDAQAGMLIKALLAYECGNECTVLDPLARIAFNNLKISLDLAQSKYQDRCEKNRQNSLKRWSKECDRIESQCESMPNKKDNINNTIKEKEEEKETLQELTYEEVEVVPVKTKKKKSSAIDLSFVDESMAPAFEMWLSYKKERNESYKTQRTLEACYRNLLQLSNNNPELAMRIVTNSIGNQYKGLFEIKNNSYGADRQTYERGLGIALANQCAEQLRRESSGCSEEEHGFVPREL